VNDIANVFLLVYAGLFPIVNPVGNSASIVPATVINGFPMSPVIVIAATSAPTSEADPLAVDPHAAVGGLVEAFEEVLDLSSHLLTHVLGRLVDVHHHCPLEQGDGAGSCATRRVT
jgi:hypothetical protein